MRARGARRDGTSPSPTTAVPFASATRPRNRLDHTAENAVVGATLVVARAGTTLR